ncbi:MAG: AI-2E family transporter [Candidatus Gracilibacteria bacterium]|jgi:predicted PurR-regulated permease PerM
MALKQKKSAKVNGVRVNLVDTLVKSRSVILPHFPGYFLIGTLLLSLVLMFILIRPFFVILVLAGVLATTFYPLYKVILKFFKNRSGLASFVTCTLVLFLIVIPLMIFVVMLSRQAVDIYGFLNQKIETGQFDQYLKWQDGNFVHDLFDPVQGQIAGFVDIRSLDLKQTLVDVARTVSTFLVAESASILKGLGGFLLDSFLLFFSLYYLFKDGKMITQKLIQLSPLSLKYDLELFKKFKEMSKLTLVSIFLVSVIKGIAGGLSFLIVGIPNPLFWGTAMAIFSVVPIIGPAIVWLPAGIFLLVNGNIIGGIFVLVWGTLIVSTLDNIFQAYFVGNQANLNQLLVFFAIFGGLVMFGLSGLIFGPLILTLCLTLLHIYQLEYRSILKK